MLEDLFALALIKKIIPAIAMERIGDHGRAEQKLHLFARHTRCEFFTCFGFDDVALLNLDAMHAAPRASEACEADDNGEKLGELRHRSGLRVCRVGNGSAAIV